MEPEALVCASRQAPTEGAGPDGISVFYHDAAEQAKYPNCLVPEDIARDRDAILAAVAAGAKMLRSQTIGIESWTWAGSMVVLEAVWTGTLAIGVGNLQPGEKMTSHFAQFYEIADGRILRQRNCDCFKPF